MKTHMFLKRAASLCMAAAMALGMCVTAHAEEVTKSGWAVEFTGKEIRSNFKPGDMYATMCTLLPGDTGSMRIDVKNTSDEYVQWYMTNDTIQSLEDTRAAARDGGYSYKLSYTSNGAAGSTSDKDGSNGSSGSSGGSVVLFDSETVGGDDSGGLYDATNGLDEFFKLCTMAPGGSGYVTLDVKLDGETQGNGYQNTLAKLRIVFAADIIPANYIEVPGDPTTVTVTDPPTRIEIPGDPTYVIPDGNPPLSDVPQYTQVPQTGDGLKAVLWSSLAMLAGIGCFAVFLAKRKKERGGAEA